jgi:ABC-2 type transport system ATP-binding protein
MSLDISNLSKSYGANPAVRSLSFQVSTGEIFGLLGPNGAGKTTTLECAIGLRRPDSGTIRIAGLDPFTQPRRVKQTIGVQLQATALPDRITVREALRLFSSFYATSLPPGQLLDRFALSDRLNDRFDTLSAGQRQRLAIALALVHQPQIVFLDEPTAGLDPQSRREVHALVRRLKEDGRTVLLSTHYIDEAEQLCDRVAIIDRGQVVASGSPASLIAAAGSQPRIAFTPTRPIELLRLRQISTVSHVENRSSGYLLSTTNVTQSLSQLVKLLEQDHNDLIDLHIQRPTLEDLFIHLTGHHIRD